MDIEYFAVCAVGASCIVGMLILMHLLEEVRGVREDVKQIRREVRRMGRAIGWSKYKIFEPDMEDWK